MTFLGLFSVSCARSPPSDHRLLFRIRPEKDDVARGVSIGERHPDDFARKLLRRLRIRDRKTSFVEMHENASPRVLYLVALHFRVVLVRFRVFLFPGRLV